MQTNQIIERIEPDKVLRETINFQLTEVFGTDTVTGLPIWRVSWAEDHYEKRFGTWEDYSPSGIYLKTVTETRTVPKYPHLKGRYVLERLLGIDPQNAQDLPDATMSYEPIHPFWNGKTEYLPPKWMVCKFIVDTVYAAEDYAKGGNGGLKKYVDPDADGNNGQDARLERLKEIKEGLFGNETAIGDHLTNKTGVSLNGPKLDPFIKD